MAPGRTFTPLQIARAKQRFLDHLAARGGVFASCKAAEVSHPIIYQWREQDPEFAAHWQAALAQYTELMEAEADRRAYEGTEKPVFQQGREVGRIREYSDDLMKFRLQALDPRKYRNNSTHIIQGDEDGGPVRCTLTFAQRLQAIAALDRSNDDSQGE